MSDYIFKKGWIAQEQIAQITDTNTFFHKMIIGTGQKFKDNFWMDIAGFNVFVTQAKQRTEKEYNTLGNGLLKLVEAFNEILQNIQEEIIFTDEMYLQLHHIDLQKGQEEIKKETKRILNLDARNHQELRLMEIKIMFNKTK
jgi:hypothetical protein